MTFRPFGFAARALAAVSFAAIPFSQALASERRSTSSADIQAVAPQLFDYTQNLLFGEIWKRPELVRRDRSMITMAALVSGGHTAQMTGHFNLALDNGVKPGEIIALITHLAFYSGWPNAISAAGVAKDVFAQRGVTVEQVGTHAAEPLPLDEKTDAQRRLALDAAVGDIAPDLVRYTNEVLFDDLWRKSDLNARDRSLVTMAALIARGQSAQLPFHLNRAMDNGLTQTQAVEVITHLAFYAGWPMAMSAVPVAKTVFDARKEK